MAEACAGIMLTRRLGSACGRGPADRRNSRCQEGLRLQVADALRARLEGALLPDRIEVIDESARHRGHAGWRPEGETHFRVVVVSAAFAGKSRIERQRLVHAAAADLLAARIHALSIQALTPEEEAGGR
jgi:BolA protein